MIAGLYVTECGIRREVGRRFNSKDNAVTFGLR